MSFRVFALGFLIGLLCGIGIVKWCFYIRFAKFFNCIPGVIFENRLLAASVRQLLTHKIRVTVQEHEYVVFPQNGDVKYHPYKSD